MHGKTVVFLHAFPFSGDMWEDQRRFLEEKEYIVYTPTYPGFGGFDDMGFRTICEYADWVREYLNHRGVEEATFVGLSMGGYVLLALMELYPRMVRGAVLSNTKSTADSPEARRRRYELVDRIEREKSIDFLIDDMLDKLFYRKEDHVISRARYIMSMASPEGVKSALLSMAARKDRTHVLQSDIPKLMIGSDKDVFSTPQDIKHMFENARNATLHMFEDVGHISNMEAPDLYNRVLYDWLSSLKI